MVSVKSLKSLVLPQVKIISISISISISIPAFFCAHMIVACDLCASVFLQVSFYTYTTAFNMVNGNASYVSIMRPRG